MFKQSFRKLVHSRLLTLERGHITLVDGASEASFGDARSDLNVRVEVKNEEFYRKLVLEGGIGAAESWARGHWQCEDLTSLLRILTRNLPQEDTANGPMASLGNLFQKVGHALRRNTVRNAKKNILKHYDLSNEFFALFLDSSMTYSSGIFPEANSSMLEASMEKVDRVCRKLDLKPGDRLLEIGTGWGALASHAARHYGAKVVTTTISDQQFQWARDRFRREGIDRQITLLSQDYRKLTGEFDKLVSIEMIEAVGHQYFDDFFRKCGQLLKPQGEMLLQSITIADHRFEHHKRSVDFIKRYIFPGGCLPSVAALTESMAKTTRLRMIHMEDFAEHYAETLLRWRNAFHDNLQAIRELGFDDRFVRIWDYYLCYCRAAFLERNVNVCQIWLANHGCTSSPVAHPRVELPKPLWTSPGLNLDPGVAGELLS